MNKKLNSKILEAIKNEDIDYLTNLRANGLKINDDIFEFIVKNKDSDTTINNLLQKWFKEDYLLHLQYIVSDGEEGEKIPILKEIILDKNKFKQFKEYYEKFIGEKIQYMTYKEFEKIYFKYLILQLEDGNHGIKLYEVDEQENGN